MYLVRFVPLFLLTVCRFSIVVVQSSDSECTVNSEVCSDDITCPYQSSKVNQQCLDGHCKCTNNNYTACSCLPNVHGCEITTGRDAAAASYKLRGFNDPLVDVYNCFSSDNTENEVHVIANYQGTGNNDGNVAYSTGNTYVNLHGSCRGVPIIIVFVSHNPVNWILGFDDADVLLAKVLLISPYITRSFVSHQHGRIADIERHDDIPWGFGDDRIHGDTVGLLEYLTRRFGVVTSFTGTYQADEWNLNLVSAFGSETTTIGVEKENCWQGDMCSGCPDEYIGGINQVDMCCPGCRLPQFIYQGTNCYCKIEPIPAPCITTVANITTVTNITTAPTEKSDCLFGNECSHCNNTKGMGTADLHVCCPNCLRDNPVIIGDVCSCSLATNDNVSGANFTSGPHSILLMIIFFIVIMEWN